jgi:hypothetical protein
LQDDRIVETPELDENASDISENER